MSPIPLASQRLLVGFEELTWLPRDAATHPGLHVESCSQAAATYACRQWHYAGEYPSTARPYGVWEDGRFIGAVVFTMPMNRRLYQEFGLDKETLRELSRVALRDHTHYVSEIVARAIRCLRHDCPMVRILVSYADPEALHMGTIYQAMNWVYLGLSTPGAVYRINGRDYHRRSVSLHFTTVRMEVLRRIDPRVTRRDLPPKHKYALALNRELRIMLEGWRLPYPKSTST